MYTLTVICLMINSLMILHQGSNLEVIQLSSSGWYPDPYLWDPIIRILVQVIASGLFRWLKHLAPDSGDRVIYQDLIWICRWSNYPDFSCAHPDPYTCDPIIRIRIHMIASSVSLFIWAYYLDPYSCDLINRIRIHVILLVGSVFFWLHHPDPYSLGRIIRIRKCVIPSSGSVFMWSHHPDPYSYDRIICIRINVIASSGSVFMWS